MASAGQEITLQPRTELSGTKPRSRDSIDALEFRWAFLSPDGIQLINLQRVVLWKGLHGGSKGRAAVSSHTNIALRGGITSHYGTADDQPMYSRLFSG